MIKLNHVSKKYPNGHVALNNISLEIELGEMIFLRGHSGAGKSTLLRLLAGFERPSRGQIIVANRNISQLKPYQVPYYRRRLGFITQHPKLLNDYTVLENVAMPLVITGFDKSEINRRVRAALERVGLQNKEQLFPSQLSEGEQQRVGIARAVVHKPRFLLADEPTGNLDPELSLEIMRLFERFHQVGVTVIVASHDAFLIDKFPYRKIHLSKGQLINPDTQKIKVVQSKEEETIDG